MTKIEFKNYMKHWYLDNAVCDTLKIDSYIDRHLFELERSDAEGDFIYENSEFVIGKYYYCDEIPPDSSRNRKSKTLCFLIYGIGRKDQSGDLENYEEFDYIIL